MPKHLKAKVIRMSASQGNAGPVQDLREPSTDDAAPGPNR